MVTKALTSNQREAINRRVRSQWSSSNTVSYCTCLHLHITHQILVGTLCIVIKITKPLFLFICQMNYINIPTPSSKSDSCYWSRGKSCDRFHHISDHCPIRMCVVYVCSSFWGGHDAEYPHKCMLEKYCQYLQH